MIVKSLMGGFQFEAEKIRKLLKNITDGVKFLYFTDQSMNHD